jgi:tetratricopeptide (TPR) repeat protein
MAKKKKPKSNRDQQPEMGSFFDPRAMEQMMNDLSRLLSEQEFESEEDVNKFLQEHLASGMPMPTMPDTRPHSDLERAQNLIYDAYEARTTSKKISLARKALTMSPDCADGYVLLAEYSAKTAAESIALFEEGVRAGERALGDEFDELRGHFWGFLETRPYMRARLGLAMTLWNAGRLEDAADHMNAMLELNPNDNQGVRHVYITLLLELGDTKRLEKLLKQYPDDWSAYWKYGHALYEFRRKGAGDKADDLLRDAIEYNSHVPPYLLGKKKLPKQHKAAFYSPGDENEALDYVVDGIRPWSQTEGALAWLADMIARVDTQGGGESDT